MPIYEFYCPDNNTIYSFFARSSRFSEQIPSCPVNPNFRLQRLISSFAVTSGGASADSIDGQEDGTSDAGITEAMQDMERDFASLGAEGEPHPRDLGKLMRRMSEMTGQKMNGPMNELIRQIEAGADPQSLEEHLVALEPSEESSTRSGGFGHHLPNLLRQPDTPVLAQKPLRDPKLYDFS